MSHAPAVPLFPYTTLFRSELLPQEGRGRLDGGVRHPAGPDYRRGHRPGNRPGRQRPEEHTPQLHPRHLILRPLLPPSISRDAGRMRGHQGPTNPPPAWVTPVSYVVRVPTSVFLSSPFFL